MAVLNKSFNTNDVADDVWPAGDYKVEITQSEIRENKKGTGSYINLGFKCTEGKFKGEMIFNNYNLWHDKENVVNIAEKQFSKLCNALGKSKVDDTNELHNIPLIIKVTERSVDDPYPGNDVKGYKACSASGEAPSKNPFKK